MLLWDCCLWGNYLTLKLNGIVHFVLLFQERAVLVTVWGPWRWQVGPWTSVRWTLPANRRILCHLISLVITSMSHILMMMMITMPMFMVLSSWLHTQYVECIYSNPVTLRSRLRVTQGHCKWNHWIIIIIIIITRGQSNLIKSASRGAHSPVRGHPRGSKVVPLNSWGRVSY